MKKIQIKITVSICCMLFSFCAFAQKTAASSKVTQTTAQETKAPVASVTADKDLQQTLTKESSFKGPAAVKATDEGQPAKAPEKQYQYPATDKLTRPADIKNK